MLPLSLQVAGRQAGGCGRLRLAQALHAAGCVGAVWWVAAGIDGSEISRRSARKPCAFAAIRCSPRSRVGCCVVLVKCRGGALPHRRCDIVPVAGSGGCSTTASQPAPPEGARQLAQTEPINCEPGDVAIPASHACRCSSCTAGSVGARRALLLPHLCSAVCSCARAFSFVKPPPAPRLGLGLASSARTPPCPKT